MFDAYRADATPLVKGRRQAERQLDGCCKPALTELHDLLMANEQHSLLVVLQGLDASGKSGTIKHVGGAFNPGRLSVACFKEPDPKEEQEHFLERIRREIPDPGYVGFFDRSHYEDAIAPRAGGELGDEDLATRVKEIREFEKELVDGGTVVVKCLLHLSYDEQRRRFLDRLERPDKQWKFTESDLETRASWPAGGGGLLRGRRPAPASIRPWFVVPADHKWYRNWAVANLLVDHLAGTRRALSRCWPPRPIPSHLIARLQPPH